MSSESGPLNTVMRVGGKTHNQPMPPKDELMKRNSFNGPNKNKYLDKFLREVKREGTK